MKRRTVLTTPNLRVSIEYLDTVALVRAEEELLMDDLSDQIAVIMSKAKYMPTSLTRIKRRP